MNYTSGLETMREINHRHPDIEIRDEQIEALDAIQADEVAGKDTSLIVLPPGSGKTVVMAADARRRLLAEPETRTLFLCDKNEILNQARKTYQRVVGGEFTYGLFSGDGRDYDELSVLFGSFQVMREWRHAFFHDEFNQGVVDESHHSMADTYKPTLDYFTFEHHTGVTATPDRLDIKDIGDIYGEPSYVLTLGRAIAQGKLASVDYYVITDEIAEMRKLFDDYGNQYPIGEFNKTLFAPKREDEIVSIAQRYGKEVSGQVKRLGFCTSIEEASRFAELFENAAAIHSRLSRRRQRELLQQYRDGELEALFTVDMFNEGVDIPDANQLLFLRSTASKNIYLQQLGRGLRITALKKRVQVLDFVNNAEHLLLADRIWKEIKLASASPEEKDLYEIDTSNIHFDEGSRNALSILNAINAAVYMPGQTVPSGSVRASSLANQLGMTNAALLTIANALGIDHKVFPTQRGGNIPYYLPDQVERLIAMRNKPVDRRKRTI